VQPQDTLYSIAWRHDLDYRALARWNGIGPDYRISVGQVLNLRPATPTVETFPAKNVPQAGTPPGAGAGPQPGIVTPPPAQQSPSTPQSASARWTWPTSAIESPHAVAGGGILLAGVLGQPVRAAGGGHIVYVGSGMRGYGNLIIIKHGETWLSAYAHNRESLVHDGQEVALGQVVGHMGEGAPGKAVLYFEIRRNGKPVDPLSFLPHIK
jgi:lipoprotein NlpD